MKPRLLVSGLTGTVYVATRYKDQGMGRIEAQTKHDVTSDFTDALSDWGIVDCPSCGGVGGFGHNDPHASEECKRCFGGGRLTVEQVVDEWKQAQGVPVE